MTISLNINNNYFHSVLRVCNLLLLCFFSNENIFAQNYSENDILGLYHVVDIFSDDESVIEIYKENDKFYGKVLKIKIYENGKKTNDSKIINISDNEPMVIFKDFEFDPNKNRWVNGSIVNPKNDKVYKAYIEIENDQEIILKGYVGVKLFGLSMKLQRINKDNYPF